MVRFKFRKGPTAKSVLKQIIGLSILLYVMDQVLSNLNSTINFADTSNYFSDAYAFMGLDSPTTSGIIGVLGIIGFAAILMQFVSIRM